MFASGMGREWNGHGDGHGNGHGDGHGDGHGMGMGMGMGGVGSCQCQVPFTLVVLIDLNLTVFKHD